MPTNQQIEACAKEIAKSAYYKTAGCSLSVSWLSEIITRHLSAPVYESIAQTVARINDTPATVKNIAPQTTMCCNAEIVVNYDSGRPFYQCSACKKELKLVTSFAPELQPTPAAVESEKPDKGWTCFWCGKNNGTPHNHFCNDKANPKLADATIGKPTPSSKLDEVCEKPCKYCGSDKGTWYRPTEPKGNFCQTCGKCCDEEVTPDTNLDEKLLVQKQLLQSIQELSADKIKLKALVDEAEEGLRRTILWAESASMKMVRIEGESINWNYLNDGRNALTAIKNYRKETK